jgi:hypothetical protein
MQTKDGGPLVPAATTAQMTCICYQMVARNSELAGIGRVADIVFVYIAFVRIILRIRKA